jgi:hypothetical protein
MSQMKKAVATLDADERITDIQNLRLPDEAPFPCSSWPTTPGARAAAEGMITLRANARIAREGCASTAEAGRILDEEVFAFFFGRTTERSS